MSLYRTICDLFRRHPARFEDGQRVGQRGLHDCDFSGLEVYGLNFSGPRNQKAPKISRSWGLRFLWPGASPDVSPRKLPRESLARDQGESNVGKRRRQFIAGRMDF
jgi:hypothetical protein